jgi:hypothetical protein
MGCGIKSIVKAAVTTVAGVYGGPIGAAAASGAFTAATGGSFTEVVTSAAISGITSAVAGVGPGAGEGFAGDVTTALGKTGVGSLGSTLGSTFPETMTVVDPIISSVGLDPIKDMTIAGAIGKAAGMGAAAYFDPIVEQTAQQLMEPLPEEDPFFLDDIDTGVIPSSREEMRLDPDFIDPTDPTTPIEDVVRVAPPPPPEYFASAGPGGTISTGLVDPANQYTGEWQPPTGPSAGAMTDWRNPATGETFTAPSFGWTPPSAGWESSFGSNWRQHIPPQPLSDEIGTYYTNPDIITNIGQLPPAFQEASVDNIIKRLTANVNDPGFDNFQDVLGTGVRTRANQLSPGTTLDEYNALFNDPNLPNIILRPEAYRRLETALPSSATVGDQFNLPDDFDFSSVLGPQRDPVTQQIRASAARGNLNPAGLDYALSDIDRISTEAESDLRNLAGPVASRYDTGFGSDYGSLRDRTRQDIADFDFVGNTTGRQFDFEDIGRQGTELLTSSQPRFAEEIDTLFRAQPSRFDYQDIANRAGTSSGFASGAPVTTGPDDSRAIIDALRRKDTRNVRGVGSAGAGVF